MNGLMILGIFCILWGLASAGVALLRPKKLWESGKIQGFVKLFGNTGAVVLLLVVGMAALAVGVWLVWSL